MFEIRLPTEDDGNPISVIAVSNSDIANVIVSLELKKENNFLWL